MIQVNKDSLGVPLEPMDKPLTDDWNEQPLYGEDVVYVLDGGLLKDEMYEIYEYLDSISYKTTVSDFLDGRKISDY